MGSDAAEQPDEDSQRIKLEEHDPLEAVDGAEREQVIDTLLTDYQVASEDARYRDRLVNQSYYLAFVIGSLLLSGAISVVTTESVGVETELLVLALISALGAVSFKLLLVYVESFRNSRNSAWARRDEIESYLRSEYPGVMETNASLSSSMNFDYEHAPEERSWYASKSASGSTRRFFEAVTLLLFLSLAISVGLYLQHVDF